MLADAKVFSAFAVSDLAQARKFYGETLGVQVSEHAHAPLLILNLAGGHDVLVYEKPDYSPPNYTVLVFHVGDIGATVGELTNRGVEFERYDEMDQDEQGITQRGPSLAAWLKDPAGNTIEVLQEL
jgi:catechol-2,3-dioxygenase